MGRKVRVGLVGLGSLAQRGPLPHTFQADAREKIEPVAVCDIVPGRAEAVAEKWQWQEAYTDYDEMLRRADIEAVLITSPIPFHYEQIMKALELGKHVYSQKSMTTTLAEADDVVKLARSKGVKLCASPGQMIRPPFPQIKQLVEEGAIGRVYWAMAGRQGRGHENEAFRREDDVLSNVDPTWYYKKGGGPVYDMTVYSLHELTGILGSVKYVSAMSGIGLPIRYWKGKAIEVEMDDNTHFLLDFGDNRFGFAFGTNCGGVGLPGLAIFGTEGTITVGRPQVPRTPGTGAQSGGRVTLTRTRSPEGGSVAGAPAPGSSQIFEQELEMPEMPYRVGPHREIGEAHGYADIMHFIDCILEDKEPIPSGEHARHVIEIMEKGYLAARERTTLALTTTVSGD